MKVEGKPPPFDPKIFLARVGAGKTRAELRKRQIVFAQGDPADAVFYIQKGKIELRVLSQQGKEAILAILGVDDFFGEGCLAGQPLRMATAVAVTECSIVRLEKSAMIAVLHDEPVFSALFISYLLTRNIRIEEDLVDQLFNSSEKSLARHGNRIEEFLLQHDPVDLQQCECRERNVDNERVERRVCVIRHPSVFPQSHTDG
jgi:CRP/FNR family transcriptional regulator, cyclic AMP receptor protein